MHSDGMLSCEPLQSEYTKKIAVSFSKYNEPLLSDTEIRQNVCKSLVLNSVSLVSIYVFDLLLWPIVREHQQHWFHRNIGWFYQVTWLLPVVGASLYLNVRFAHQLCNSLLIVGVRVSGARRLPNVPIFSNTVDDLSLRPPNLQPTQVSSAPSLPLPIDSS